MALIQRIHQPTVGLIPIGDRFTMGPETAALACNEFLDLEVIVPIHWGTFDLLSGDPQTFKSLVKRGEVAPAAAGRGAQPLSAWPVEAPARCGRARLVWIRPGSRGMVSR